MPLCPLCATDFPVLSADTTCKRCTVLQALGVGSEHPNYIQTQASTIIILIDFRDAHTMSTQGWKQCLHCGISVPHLGTAPNMPKTVCLNQDCISWASPIDGKFDLSVNVMIVSHYSVDSLFRKGGLNSFVWNFFGVGTAHPCSTNSTEASSCVYDNSYCHDAQTSFKQWDDHCCLQCELPVLLFLSRELMKVLWDRSAAAVPELPTPALVRRQFQNQD